MALNSSGPISLGGSVVGESINLELGLPATAQVSLNDTVVRALLAKSSGTNSLLEGRGKSSVFKATISTNQTDLNLRTWALAAGWDGTTAAEITIDTNIEIKASTTATYALTIDGAWSKGIKLVNKGKILGKGGQGGSGGSVYVPTGQPGLAGGAAILLGINTTIDNALGTIGGGGGGGGGGGALLASISYGGGSGGGGASTGLPGAIGTGNPNASPYNGPQGGTATTTTGAAGGNAGAGYGIGGAGGSLGTAGTAGTRSGPATGYTLYNGGAGGAAGKAVNLNGFTVTWIATGTRLGAIS